MRIQSQRHRRLVAVFFVGQQLLAPTEATLLDLSLRPTADELPIDARHFVHFGNHDVQPTQFVYARPEPKVGTATGPVGCHDNAPSLGGLGGDIGFPRFVVGGQDVVREVGRAQQFRETFRLLDAAGADQDRTSGGLHPAHFRDNRPPAGRSGAENTGRQSHANRWTICRDLARAEFEDSPEFSGKAASSPKCWNGKKLTSPTDQASLCLR